MTPALGTFHTTLERLENAITTAFILDLSFEEKQGRKIK